MLFRLAVAGIEAALLPYTWTWSVAVETYARLVPFDSDPMVQRLAALLDEDEPAERAA